MGLEAEWILASEREGANPINSRLFSHERRLGATLGSMQKGGGPTFLDERAASCGCESSRRLLNVLVV
jgi:hypothetical protein